MMNTYTITGMTCESCVALITEKLTKVDGVTNVTINLKEGIAAVVTSKTITLDKLVVAVPDTYTISEKNSSATNSSSSDIREKTKFHQLKPLFLLFIYLFGAVFFKHFKDWNTTEAMLDFMGLFYIVFSFFKLIDLKGFMGSFRMYDPLAKVWPTYGWIYPFIELLLGILFLLRLSITLALIATMVILGITTLGVIKTLIHKKDIQCACLGTALKLPMTEATLIENAIMLFMAISMLVL